MLQNDPPPGTPVRLLKDVTSGFRTLKAYTPATLVKALQKYIEDRPEDLFDIRIGTDVVTVRRSDIEKA
jgi:hypothetical protein